MAVSKELQDRRTAVAVRFADPNFAIDFIVDNNPRAVDAVLRTKNIRVGSSAEMKTILKSFVTTPTVEGNQILAGVVNVPYLNDAPNYTGGLNGDPTLPTLSGWNPSDLLKGISDIACGLGSIFGGTGGCTTANQGTSNGVTQAQLDTQIKAQEAQQRANTIIIISVAVVLFIIILAVIILMQKRKASKAST